MTQSNPPSATGTRHDKNSTKSSWEKHEQKMPQKCSYTCRMQTGHNTLVASCAFRCITLFYYASQTPHLLSQGSYPVSRRGILALRFHPSSSIKMVRSNFPSLHSQAVCSTSLFSISANPLSLAHNFATLHHARGCHRQAPETLGGPLWSVAISGSGSRRSPLTLEGPLMSAAHSGSRTRRSSFTLAEKASQRQALSSSTVTSLPVAASPPANSTRPNTDFSAVIA